MINFIRLILKILFLPVSFTLLFFSAFIEFISDENWDHWKTFNNTLIKTLPFKIFKEK